MSTLAVRIAALLCLTVSPLSAQSALDAMPTPMQIPRYNVVLVVIDALRPDHLGAYGYERNTSPRIDELASEGFTFLNAISQANWTLPALASIMTSLYPSVHGAIRFPRDINLFVQRTQAGEKYTPDSGGRLDGSRRTLAAALRAQGYVTAAFVSGGFCRSEFGFDQGFDSYVNSDDKLAELDKKIFRWLDSNRTNRFFLYLHTYDVHEPYSTTSHYDNLWDPDYRGAIDGRTKTLIGISNGSIPFSKRDLYHLLALYDGDISYTDEHLGRLFDKLERLGLKDKTIIIITSDHGEEFMEHGARGHSISAYDPAIKVPLIIRAPGMRSKGKVSSQVRSIDIFPTILELLHLASPWPIQGASLVPLMAGRQMAELASYTETGTRSSPRTGVAIRTKRWKYIRHLSGRPSELYDLESDPGETRNLASHRPSILKEFKGKYADWENQMKTEISRLPRLPSDPSLTEEVERKLRIMGYIK